MKEERYFYVPNAHEQQELPEEEAQHALRVLRLNTGDSMVLMDGRGIFYRAEISGATKKRCLYRVMETLPQSPLWTGRLHLAMAPTKNIDRVEWLAEKATEIGLDELSFVRCQFSERTTLKPERIERIVTSAMKQSRKPWRPVLNPMADFADFVGRDFAGQKFICHCYEQPDLQPKLPLNEVISPDEDALVLVGPEGDFSIDEVKMAEARGFRPVSLGNSRLRTETAALVATLIMRLFH